MNFRPSSKGVSRYDAATADLDAHGRIVTLPQPAVGTARSLGRGCQGQWQARIKKPPLLPASSATACSFSATPEKPPLVSPRSGFVFLKTVTSVR